MSTKPEMSKGKAWAIVAAVPAALLAGQFVEAIAVVEGIAAFGGAAFGTYKAVTDPRGTLDAVRGFFADTVAPAFSTAFSSAKATAIELDSKLDQSVPRGPANDDSASTLAGKSAKQSFGGTDAAPKAGGTAPTQGNTKGPKIGGQ